MSLECARDIIVQSTLTLVGSVGTSLPLTSDIKHTPSYRGKAVVKNATHDPNRGYSQSAVGRF